MSGKLVRSSGDGQEQAAKTALARVTLLRHVHSWLEEILVTYVAIPRAREDSRAIAVNS